MTVTSTISCGQQRTYAVGMRYVTESPDDRQRGDNGRFQKVTAKKGEKFLMETKLFIYPLGILYNLIFYIFFPLLFKLNLKKIKLKKCDYTFNVYGKDWAF